MAGISVLDLKRWRIGHLKLFIPPTSEHTERNCVVYIAKRRRPLNLVDESWPCDLSVINGYDSPWTLRTVEDRYPAWSDLSGVVA
ncbi:LOW QUALITY PROTEIN: hypothetical protein HID58_002531, partial [Brassica napus]